MNAVIKPAGSASSSTASTRPRKQTAASQFRDKIRNEILERRSIRLFPFAEDPETQKELAGRELTRFADAVGSFAIMHDYFDRDHIANMRNHLDEATHGFITLRSGLIVEVSVIPEMDDNVMGFHLFNAFDPKDRKNTQGTMIGYSIYTVFWNRGSEDQPNSRKVERVGLAFDIFIPYRGDRQTSIRFDRHELYNVSRTLLVSQFKPELFTVDARTQIYETWTGDPVKRCGYYLKRGYYPPDQKAMADLFLTNIVLKNKKLSRQHVDSFLRSSHAPEWVFSTRQGAD